jgi:opacity protein-like surface antigen
MPQLLASSSRLAAALALVLLALGLAAAAPPAARAQSSNANTPVLFLRIEPDSRSAGMGNTGVAHATDANAIFWNPAGLAFQTNTQIGLTHINWLPELDAGLFYEYLVGTYHAPKIGTFGGHISFFNLGESEIRSSDNQLDGTFRSYDLALGGSLGRKITEQFAVGVGVRGIYSYLAPAVGEIQSGSGSAFAFDLAALYRSRPQNLLGTDVTFSSGLNLANMGTFIKYNEANEPLPMNIRFGPAVTFDFDEYNQLTIASDLNKVLARVEETCTTDADGEQECNLEATPFYESLFTGWGPVGGEQVNTGEGQQAASLSLAEQFTVGVGLEYWYNQLFALRTGYFYEDPENGDRRFLTFGAGLRYNIVGIDISYIYSGRQNDPVANTLRFSLLLSFQ